MKEPGETSVRLIFIQRVRENERFAGCSMVDEKHLSVAQARKELDEAMAEGNQKRIVTAQQKFLEAIAAETEKHKPKEP